MFQMLDFLLSRPNLRQKSLKKVDSSKEEILKYNFFEDQSIINENVFSFILPYI
jgi:hypothetical protein